MATISKWLLVELTGIPYMNWRVYKKGKFVIIKLENGYILPHQNELFYYDYILKGRKRRRGQVY